MVKPCQLEDVDTSFKLELVPQRHQVAECRSLLTRFRISFLRPCCYLVNHIPDFHHCDRRQEWEILWLQPPISSFLHPPAATISNSIYFNTEAPPADWQNEKLVNAVEKLWKSRERKNFLHLFDQNDYFWDRVMMMIRLVVKKDEILWTITTTTNMHFHLFDQIEYCW